VSLPRGVVGHARGSPPCIYDDVICIAVSWILVRQHCLPRVTILATKPDAILVTHGARYTNLVTKPHVGEVVKHSIRPVREHGEATNAHMAWHLLSTGSRVSP
jgi:hypothetical protein